MHTIYHIACDPLAEVPAGVLVTDSREYAEYFGWIKRRRVLGVLLHPQAHAGFHEVCCAATRICTGGTPRNGNWGDALRHRHLNPRALGRDIRIRAPLAIPIPQHH